MDKGKSVLVTGALRGIGRAVSLRLASEGYHVVLNCRKSSIDRAKALEEEIRGLGGQAGSIVFDIADREECRNAIEGYIQENGAFWGIVLNAGICRDNLLVAMDDDDWDSVIHTNLDGFYNVLRPAMMSMCKKRRGRVVAISSVSGVMGNKGQVNYSAAKAGLIGAAKALALEVATRNITVNVVAPGIIETDMIQGLLLDRLLEMVPMNRLGKPDEIASLVAFLLGDDAGYITRQVISINGGMC